MRVAGRGEFGVDPPARVACPVRSPCFEPSVGGRGVGSCQVGAGDRRRGVAGLPPYSAAVGAATAKEGVAVEAAVAMADTEEYCTGYERTFHGEWSDGAGGADGGRPVLFRIGVDSGGTGCYAQLNVITPLGVAPYELRRFRAEAGGDGAWTLRYRDTVLEIDSATGTAVRRKGDETPQPGTLLAHAPAVGDSPPAPPAKEQARWYGKWRGRLSEVPFRVTLRFTESGSGTVKG